MSLNPTNIGFCSHTCNPFIGCNHAGSPGCDHCYARELHNKRHKALKLGNWPDAPKQYHFSFENRIQYFPERLDKLQGGKPKVIFMCSVSDLFNQKALHDHVFNIIEHIRIAKQHQIILCTKRPGIAVEFFKIYMMTKNYNYEDMNNEFAHVWFGVSIENTAVQARAYIMQGIPIPNKFINFEPLLGAINIPLIFNTMSVDWIITGGETGPEYRSVPIKAFVDLSQIAREKEIPCFFKQWPGKKQGIHKTFMGSIKHEFPDKINKIMINYSTGFDTPHLKQVSINGIGEQSRYGDKK